MDGPIGVLSLPSAEEDYVTPTSPRIGLDWTLAALLLVILFVPCLCIAAAIKLDSRGDVFFRQPRIGFRNQSFMIWKFRTMQSAASDVRGTQLTARGDPRITRVGIWLRKWSIDEWPQLLNVLAGEMSLVGPRPHALHAKAGDRFYQDVVPDYARRHSVKPGITGWAQVNGCRGETTTYHQIQQRVAYDLEYIENQSLKLDLWIMLLTVIREVRSNTAF